ncbi:MAG: ABC transporter permease, partial [Gemmatimonadaceae bacterium]
MPLIRPGIRQLFRLATRSKLAREVDDEIALHLELREQRLRDDGLSHDEARTEALRRFGVVSATQNALHTAATHRDTIVNIRELISSVVQDVRYTARGLVREPWFTAFVAITLALGIGMNAAMYGVIDRLLLRGPEYVRDANRVQNIYFTTAREGSPPNTSNSFGYVTYKILRENARTFQVAAYKISPQQEIFGNGVKADLISSGQTTADFFSMLGVTPLLGRFYSETEDNTTSPEHVVVLGYRLWQRSFNSDPGIVGTFVELSGEKFTVIGVARNGFTGTELAQVDVWMPLSIRSRRVTNDWTNAWDAQWLNVVARLNPGASAEQAGAEATSAFRAAYAGRSKAAKSATISFAPISFAQNGSEPLELRVSRWLIGVCAI